MNIQRLLALASACAALGGCFQSKQEVFSLQKGDELPLVSEMLGCVDYDENGNQRTGPHQQRLIKLVADKKVSYVFVGERQKKGIAGSSPFTAHKIRDGLYVLALSLQDQPGEMMYVAQINQESFVGFKYPGDRAKEVARKHHTVIISYKNGLWAIGGDVKGQKAFVLEMGSSIQDAQKFIECTLDPS